MLALAVMDLFNAEVCAPRHLLPVHVEAPFLDVAPCEEEGVGSAVADTGDAVVVASLDGPSHAGLHYASGLAMGSAFLDIPASQQDRAGIPRVVMLVQVIVWQADVVHTDAWQPAVFRWGGSALWRFAVGVEDPPAIHIKLITAARRDGRVGGALRAANKPVGNVALAQDLGQQLPKKVH